MQKFMIHPNSRILLNAWRKMVINPKSIITEDGKPEYSDLLSQLFILTRTSEDIWIFSKAGDTIKYLCNRELEEQDFLSLWSGHDRVIATALIESALSESEAGIIRAAGKSLRGLRCDVEILLAPFESRNGLKILGLYQPLGGEAMLRGQHIWKHSITSLQMPHSQVQRPHIRLVASND